MLRGMNESNKRKGKCITAPLALLVFSMLTMSSSSYSSIFASLSLSIYIYIYIYIHREREREIERERERERERNNLKGAIAQRILARLFFNLIQIRT